MNEEIYNSEREGCLNLLSQLQRLKEEGKCVYSLEDETYERLLEIVEKSDAERLAELRHELGEICPQFKKKHGNQNP